MPIKVSLTIPVELYTYNELSDKAKESPRNYFIENWIDDWWSKEIISECKDDAKEYGFNIDHVMYKGFHSQGDGACWTGNVQIMKFLEKFGSDSIGFEGWRVLYNEISAGVTISIQRSIHARYYNTDSMCVDVSDFDIIDYIYKGDTIKSESILKGMSVEDVTKLITADADCPYKIAEDVHNWILTEARNYGETIYRRLQDGYEHMCTDEYIGECYDCNDIYFNKEGGQVDSAIVAIYLHETKQLNK
jgi:hypothetical protein